MENEEHVDGETCGCVDCEAEFQRQLAHWKPIYGGEVTAGIHKPKYLYGEE